MKRPPIIRESPPSRAPVLVALGLVLLAGAVLFVFDPARSGFYPPCLFHATTGLYCPGCGGLRGLHALLHGHWLAALRFNFLAYGLGPLLGVLGLWAWSRHGRGRPWATCWTKPWIPWALGGLVIGFGILRNVPVAPFTLLAP